jgi:hypothetical protein
VIRGTRITVRLIVRKLSEGAMEDALLQVYSHLTRGHPGGGKVRSGRARAGGNLLAWRVTLAEAAL